MSCLSTMSEAPRHYAALEKHSKVYFSAAMLPLLIIQWSDHIKHHLLTFKIQHNLVCGLQLANFCCWKIASHPVTQVIRASTLARQSRLNKLFIDFTVYQSLWKKSFCNSCMFFFFYLWLSDPVPQTEGQTIYWPSPSVLTARLRRLITASQRFTKSRQILQIHQTQSQSQPTMILSGPLYPLPSAFNDTFNPKMAAKIERQQR